MLHLNSLSSPIKETVVPPKSSSEVCQQLTRHPSTLARCDAACYDPEVVGRHWLMADPISCVNTTPLMLKGHNHPDGFLFSLSFSLPHSSVSLFGCGGVLGSV